LQRVAQLLGPPLIVLTGVVVRRLVDAAVHAPVRLLIAMDVYSVGADSVADRRLPDAGRHALSAPFDRAHSTDIDGLDQSLMGEMVRIRCHTILLTWLIGWRREDRRHPTTPLCCLPRWRHTRKVDFGIGDLV